jgi:prepilin-type N-terminal cleavage/methylation domain-containing protein
MYLIMQKQNKNFGFTLIELLVVISIIGLLASIALISLKGAAAQARDARRISDIGQLRLALSLYMSLNGQFPQPPGSGSGECNGGWDSSGDGDFIPELRQSGLLSQDFRDNWLDGNNGGCGNYQYHVFPAGNYGCDAARGRYYVLQVIDMETVPGSPDPAAGTHGGPHPQSPGFSCPGYNFNTAWAEYVTGEFENR